jgi:phosphatidylglycerophosphate synthase
MSWLSEYKKSLKNLHAEEPLDVYFYRPLAFVIVKALYSLPITPNQYSLLALLSGIASGYYFAKGDQVSLQWGAFYFFLFAVLDCCDGMVARLKKNGTEFGRLIDGLVDYTVNAIAYITLAIGFKKQISNDLIQPWILVVGAGLSKALHSICYDRYLNEYLAYEKGNDGFVALELDLIKNKIEVAKKEGRPIRSWALSAYHGYTALQAGKAQKTLPFDPKQYCQRNLKALRMWSMIGPAVHIAFLVLALILKMPNLLFIYAIIIGNLWLVMMFVYQFKINQELQVGKFA